MLYNRKWLVHAIGMGCSGFIVLNLARNCLSATAVGGGLQQLLTLLAPPFTARTGVIRRNMSYTNKHIHNVFNNLPGYLEQQKVE